jgi:hypothetical protein
MDAVSDFSRDRTYARVTLSLLFLFSLTGNASANAGTPLIITSALHLLFGNLLLGIFEGCLLKDFFASGQRWVIPVMILANYASAWSAAALMNATYWDTDFLNLDNVRWFFLAMIVVAWVFTIVMEWPFIWLCFRGEIGAWKRSLQVSLKIQSISYVVMMVVYWYVSDTSLLSGTTVAKPSDFQLPDGIEIYYIAPEDGDVYRRSISGEAPEKVSDLNSKSYWDRLFVTPMTDGMQTDLKALLSTPERKIDLASGLAVRNVPSADKPREERDTWFKVGDADKLAVPVESEWGFETGFWGAEGLVAKNRKRGKRIELSLETPFVTWYARNAVHIAGDLVLFQLGTNQICVFHPATRRIAKLWNGQGFVAVIPRKE